MNHDPSPESPKDIFTNSEAAEWTCRVSRAKTFPHDYASCSLLHFWVLYMQLCRLMKSLIHIYLLLEKKTFLCSNWKYFLRQMDPQTIHHLGARLLGGIHQLLYTCDRVQQHTWIPNSPLLPLTCMHDEEFRSATPFSAGWQNHRDDSFILDQASHPVSDELMQLHVQQSALSVQSL